MDTRLRVAGIAGAIIVSGIILLSPSPGVPLPDPATTQDGGNDAVIVLATGLDEPRAITIHGTKIFVAEKSGAIRLVSGGELLERPIVRLRAANAHDGGLVGLAVHPEFAENHILYAYLTYEEDGRLWNRVMWVHSDGDRASDAGTILDRIPGSDFSNGGAIAFGPDGKLYVGTGATSDSLRLSQDPESLAGKILRINDNGTIPADNPTTGSAVYAIGFRNPQGIDWDADGNLIVADVGPTKNDEINIVSPGTNYGWPDEQCSGMMHVGSVACFDPGLGPGGIAVYSGGALAPTGSVVIASLQANGIYSLSLDDGSQDSILGGLGRMRDVVASPDGSIYAITSNTDNRGFASEGDDRLLQVVR